MFKDGDNKRTRRLMQSTSLCICCEAATCISVGDVPLSVLFYQATHQTHSMGAFVLLTSLQLIWSHLNWPSFIRAVIGHSHGELGRAPWSDPGCISRSCGQSQRTRFGRNGVSEMRSDGLSWDESHKRSIKVKTNCRLLFTSSTHLQLKARQKICKQKIKTLHNKST